MAKIYYRNVKENGYPLEQVPQKWRQSVAELLNDDGNEEGSDNNGR